MIYYIIIGIACLFIGSLVSVIICRKSAYSVFKNSLTQQINKENAELINENKNLAATKQQLTTDSQSLLQQIEKQQNDYRFKIDKLNSDFELEQEKLKSISLSKQKDIEIQQEKVNNLYGQAKTLQANLDSSREEAKKNVEIFYNQQMELAQEKLDHALEQAGNKFQQDEEDFRSEYLAAMADAASEFEVKIASLALERDKAAAALKELQDKVNSAVEANKRAEEMRQKQDYYRLQIPTSDLEEIKKLRSIEPYLRDKEAINKVIWKVYYEKPCTDLIGRVIGQGTKTGIYKITNIQNGMCYVGQAADLANRWKQHIKRGIGAESVTRNKLYPAMKEIGVENFTFEVLEECERSKLDAREDYWQQFYHSMDYGYSIK